MTMHKVTLLCIRKHKNKYSASKAGSRAKSQGVAYDMECPGGCHAIAQPQAENSENFMI